MVYPYPFGYFGEEGYSEGDDYYNPPPVLSLSYDSLSDQIKYTTPIGWVGTQWAALTKTAYINEDIIINIHWHSTWAKSQYPPNIVVRLYIDDMTTPYSTWKLTDFNIYINNIFLSKGYHTIKWSIKQDSKYIESTFSTDHYFGIVDYGVEEPVNYTISGTTFDDSNNILPDTTIQINDQQIVTDENGYYSIIAEPGIYNMVATKEGYIEDSAIIEVVDSDLIQDFILQLIEECPECPVCPDCTPDKLDWWLLLVGGAIGHILKKNDKKDKK